MKHLQLLSFLLTLLFIISCSNDSNITYPAKYVFDGIEIESIKAFEYDGSNFSEISISQSGDPELGDPLGFLESVELISSSEAIVVDNFESNEISYETNNNAITFISNGSKYDMDLINNGQSLELLIGRAGPYDGLNSSFASASCSDIDCNQDFSELLYGSFEGEIQYFIIFKEKYIQE